MSTEDEQPQEEQQQEEPQKEEPEAPQEEPQAEPQQQEPQAQEEPQQQEPQAQEEPQQQEEPAHQEEPQREEPQAQEEPRQEPQEEPQEAGAEDDPGPVLDFESCSGHQDVAAPRVTRASAPLTGTARLARFARDSDDLVLFGSTVSTWGELDARREAIAVVSWRDAKKWSEASGGATVRHIGDTPPKSADKAYHAFDGGSTKRTKVTQVVLHETNGYFGCQPSWGVHFFVDPDGVIFQCCDVDLAVNHAGAVNPRSIGIELGNDTYDTYDGAGEPAPKRDRISIAKWRGNKATTIVIPPLHQLEKLFWLVGKLVGEPSAAHANVRVPQRWPNVYPGALDGGHDGFLFQSQNGTAAITARLSEDGVRSHSSVPGNSKTAHGDGAFLALFLYLRMEKSMKAEPAYAEAKRLVRDGRVKSPKPFVNAGADTINLLDLDLPA